MEVVVQSPPQSPNLDNFNNNLNNNRGTMSSSSPYSSPPSSPPKRLGEFYLSAPSSPSRISQLFGGEFDYFDSTVTNTSAVNDDDGGGGGDDGFAFFLSNETKESYSRSAEELFYGGKIKPLEAAEGRKFQIVEEDSNKVFKDFQPKKNNDSHRESEHRRGRDRTPSSSSSTTLSSSNSSRRVTRSHSPYRTPQWEQQNQEQEQEPISNKEGSIRLTSLNSSKGSSSSSKRWRLRDLLLFRSASEGRGSTKDQFKSILYNNNKNKHEEVNKISSFRSIDLNSSSSSSSLRRKGHVSAHELHYAMKRAESEDMKKRTFLPYKKGILGRLSGFGI